jgi:hypothetical protein
MTRTKLLRNAALPCAGLAEIAEPLSFPVTRKLWQPKQCSYIVPFALKATGRGMLDDATLRFAKPIAAIVGVTSFVIASFSSIRALDSLCALIREKRPDRWADPGPLARMYHQGPPVFRDQWISRVVLGVARLDIYDDDYRSMLWTVRRRMMASGLILIAILVGVIWFSALG